MTVRFEQSSLNDALKLVAQVAAKSNQLPIYSAVRLTIGGGSGSAIATDGDISVFAHVSGDDDDLGGLDVVVPARHLAAFVNSVKGIVTLDMEDNDLHVTAGGSSLTLRTMPVEDFPSIPTADGDVITLDASARAKLGTILYAASKDSARPILTGVGLGDGWAACTDSYRLAAVEIGGLPKSIIPARVFDLVFKHATGDVAVVVDDRRVTFRTATATYTSRLIEGTFPNWRALVPASSPHVLIVDRDSLVDAIGRVGVLVANDEPVRLEPADGGVRLSVRARDVGEAAETVPAEYDFDQPIAFNSKYLVDLLKSGDEGKVDLGVESSAKPACVGSLEDGGVQLIMPVRTS